MQPPSDPGDGPVIEELPDDEPTVNKTKEIIGEEPQEEENLVDNPEGDQNERSKLKRKLEKILEVKRLQRKNAESLIRNLPNLAPGARENSKANRANNRILPITEVSNAKPPKILRSEKPPKKGAGEGTKTEQKRQVKSRRDLNREVVSNYKGWIIDTTSRPQTESLEWLAEIEFQAMGEGVLFIKVHTEQIPELDNIAKLWEATFVNTISNVFKKGGPELSPLSNGVCLQRVHSTYRVYYLKRTGSKQAALSIAKGRNPDVNVLGETDGRVTETREMMKIMAALLPEEKQFAYLGGKGLRTSRAWRLFDVEQARLEWVEETTRKALSKRKLENRIAKICRITAETMTDEQVDQLEKDAKANEPLESIEFGADEQYHEDPPEKEYGYGENTEEIENEHEAVLQIVDAKLDATPELTSDQRARLRKIILKRIDAFGIEQSMCRMSKLDPIEVELKPGHEPPNSYGRTLGYEQRMFLNDKIKDLIKIGILKESANPIYGSPIFIVPKKGPKKWRMVVDMRALNTITIKTAMEMPLLDEQIDWIKGAKVFGTFDVLSGFDFLPTAENSQKYFTLITKEGAYTMCGAPMGWVNTPALFMDRMVRNILKPIGIYGIATNGAIQWLDDTCLYADSFDRYAKLLDKFLAQMIKRAVRLSIDKCHLYGEEVEWCGRRINAKGWNFQSKFYDKILTVQKPQRVWEMAQVIYLCNWLSPAIPKLSQLRDTFNQFTGGKMKKAKKENKLLEWTPELNEAWEVLLDAVRDSSEKNLKRYDPDDELLLFTDASDSYWSLVVMQCTQENLKNAFDENGKLTDIYQLKPRPLMFLSGKFQGNQAKWHISNKELFPIIHAFARLNYLMVGHPRNVHVFTDHANLVDILRPKKARNASYAQRLNRWGMLLQWACIIVHHLKGEWNFVADLLTRWGAYVQVNRVKIEWQFPKDIDRINFQDLLQKKLVKGQALTAERLVNVRRTKKESKKEKRTRTSRLAKQLQQMDEGRISFQCPLYKKEFKKIKLADIRNAQNEELPEEKRPNTGPLYKKEGKLVIPNSLVTRLILHHHIAEQHPSPTAEFKMLMNEYAFTLKPGDVRDMVELQHERCLHCDRVPKLIRTPLNITELAKNTGEILHADYLYINKSGYILTLVDSLSRKTWLKYCTTASADNVVDIVMEWRSAFGLVPGFLLVTDNASHFSNRILTRLAEKINFEQTFSVSYSPWTNGAAERINSEILKTMKALMSQYQLHESEWWKLLPHVMHAINNRPLPSRENLTANQIFLAKDPPKESLFEPELHPILSRTTGELATPSQQSLRELVEQIQSEVEEKISRVYNFVKLHREYKNSRANKNRQPRIQYAVGDWVLVSTAGTPRAQLSKIKKDWGGPVQIVEIVSDNVYTVEDLQRKRTCVHAARMWFYDGDDFVPTEEMRELFQGDWGLMEVSELTDLKYQGGKFEVETYWLGFDEPTWEPLSNLHKFIPDKVAEFIDKGVSSDRRKQFLRAQKTLIKKQKDKDVMRLVITTAAANSQPKTVDWREEEDNILKACMAKYGVGRFQQIHSALHLPFRSKAQLCQRTKVLLGIQALQTFTGIHLEADRVKKDNRRKYDTDYFVNRSGIPLSTFERQTQWEENSAKYGLTPKQIREIKVPYYRRPEDPDHLRLKKEEAIEDLVEAEEFLLQQYELDKQRNAKSETYYRKHFIPKVEFLLQENPEWGYKHFNFPAGKIVSLGNRKEAGISTLAVVDTTGTFDPFEVARRDHIVREDQLIPEEQSFLRTTFVTERLLLIMTPMRKNADSRTREIVVCERLNSNLWIMSSNIHGKNPWWFFTVPEESKPITLNISVQTLQSYARANGNWDIVIADPPWNIAATNPTRGVALAYSTMSVKEILKLPFEELQAKGGFLFMWVVTKSHTQTIRAMKSRGYEFLEEIVWLKYSRRGVLRKSPANFFLRCKESCLLFQKGPSSESKTTCSLPDVLACLRRAPSQKPDELHDLAEKLVPGGRYLELFARGYNLRRNWTSLGNQVFDGTIYN